MKDDGPVEKLLLKENPRGIERILGIVCLCVGVLLALFALTLIQRSLFRQPHGSIYALLVIATALTFMFLVAGVRLLRGKRDGHKSLFAPWVWFTISGALLFTAAVFVVVAASDPTFAAAQGFASALLLALLAYGAGSHSRSNSRRKGRDAA